MKNAIATTLLVAAALAGSISLAAAQQAGGPGGNGGGNGGRGGHGGGASTSSALDARSAARPCVTHNCTPERKQVITKVEGECSCTYTQYTDASGDYYKKVCIRIDGVSARQLRCAF
ncbi:hypothetical protein E2A64_05980 [Pseudohoeflea suaedae]|uniref:Uncharacterized protein n=1 Tax=Pseudohoeflea suaedae TaxID=877384 RepID=A0A4V3A7F6_9HYPH|nr:hypothetical protein [Pseudohoeflea suaedae]TDH38645.1 hypothetical protein E2A64_05980 [Pseudohoeflea suaedae]